MLKRLRHPNILPFIGSVILGSDIFLVSPWMDNGNMTGYLRKDPDANCLKLVSSERDRLVPAYIGLIYRPLISIL